MTLEKRNWPRPFLQDKSFKPKEETSGLTTRKRVGLNRASMTPRSLIPSLELGLDT